MGTIADKLTYLNTTKTMLRDSLNKFDSNILTTDTFRSYDAKLNAIYNKLPKVTTTGQGMTIYDVQNGYLDDFKMNGTELCQNTLPNEYQAVEYIESTGTQYIDTGIQTTNNTKISIEAINTFGKTDASQPYGGSLFGARKSNSNSNYCYVTGSLNDFVGTGSGFNQITKNTNISLLKIDYDNSSVKITCGNYNYTANFSINITNSYNIYLFASNQENVAINIGTYKLYSCKIYENNILVRDFVTCYRKADNEIGLYDFITNTFFTNQGTGTFTVGNTTTLPNPDYPQTIKVVEGRQTITDKGKNLFDKNNANYLNAYMGGNTGNIVESTEDKCIYISCKSNTTYTVKKIKDNTKNRFRIGFTNTIPAIGSTCNPHSGNQDTLTDYTLTSNSSNKYLVVYYFVTGGELTEQQILDSIQIEEGSTATNYEPYHEPVSYNIDLHGKNIFDGQYEDGYYNNANGQKPTTQDPYGRRSTNLNEIKSNTNYIISINGNVTNYSIRLFFYDINCNFISTDTTDNGTFTTPANCCYITWHSSALKQNYPDGIPNMMIEQGNVATTYEEYYNYKLAKMPNTTYKNKIYRNNGNWYFEENTKKIVLDGSENIYRQVMNDGTTYRFHITENDIKSFASNELPNMYSNKFIQISRSEIYGYNNGMTANTSMIMIYYDTFKLLTLAEFKNWLSSNKPIIYYVLNEPVTTQITNTTLINQLESLYLHTGTNIITVSNDNNVIPEIEITRLKELERLS